MFSPGERLKLFSGLREPQVKQINFGIGGKNAPTPRKIIGYMLLYLPNDIGPRINSGAIKYKVNWDRLKESLVTSQGIPVCHETLVENGWNREWLKPQKCSSCIQCLLGRFKVLLNPQQSNRLYMQ